MGRLQLAAVAVLLLAGLVQGSTVNRYPPRFEDRSVFFEEPNLRSIDTRADEIDYRLPNKTSPSHYDVTITTNVHTGELSFKGVVVITIRADEELTKNIVLHARQLENFTCTIVDTTTGVSKKLNPSYETTREFLTLTPEDNSELVQGRFYTLTIAYDGLLRRDNGGFYLSTYKNSKGETVNLATTQFESTDARHGFPCYDEPAKRATFTITINHSPTYRAISNMPVDTEKSSNGKTVFLQTPKMPTYLIAYVVSDFEYTSGSLNGLTQRIFSRPGTQGDQEFALFTGIQTTARLADYFNVPFTLPKLDQVAVPDFAAGAMENWGIATYREQYLLYNPQTSTSNSQTNIANIIAHEYTHMWFGDLVTVKWWTYLWLKEGFATMFSYKSADEVYPDWGIMQLFIVGEYQSALAYDGGAQPRPMTHYVQTPREISAVYDTVSYGKAGAVLFMWQHALTDAIFSAGLNKYLLLNGFTGAEEDDLFNAIGSAAKDEGVSLPDTVSLMMKTWTNKGGVPLLTVERDYEKGTFTITQNSFFNNKNISDESVWYVPVNYATSKYSDFSNTAADYYLNNIRSIKIDGKDLGADDWLILNKQSTGYYRVQYDEKNWGLISDGLIAKPNRIHPHNRASLMNDAYRLSATNRLKHSILLNLMTYLQNEDQYAPWSTASTILTTYNSYLSGDRMYVSFKDYVGDLVSNIYERLGAYDDKGEQHFQKNVRSFAINLACLVGVKSCLIETNDRIKVLAAFGTEIEPNLRSVIHCNGLRESGDTEFNYMYQRLMDSADQNERNDLISSLGCSQNPNQVKKFIESSISKSSDVTLATQEKTTLLSSAYSRGEVGLLASIDFLDANHVAYAGLTTAVGAANPLHIAIVGMSNYVVNDNQATKLRALVEKVKGQPGVSANLGTSVEANINTNFKWLEENRDPIINWVIEYKSSAGSVFGSIVPAVIAVCYVVVRFL